MPLYTFIADYDGGTYVSQTAAPDAPTAVLSWAENLDAGAIPDLDAQAKAELIEALRQGADDGPTRLEGLNNVWCLAISVRRKLMLVNVVQTEHP